MSLKLWERCKNSKNIQKSDLFFSPTTSSSHRQLMAWVNEIFALKQQDNSPRVAGSFKSVLHPGFQGFDERMAGAYMMGLFTKALVAVAEPDGLPHPISLNYDVRRAGRRRHHSQH